jgi:hypothetical protein
VLDTVEFLPTKNSKASIERTRAAVRFVIRVHTELEKVLQHL